MAVGGPVEAVLDVPTPDARTRSIWLTQLVLGASVVTINVVVLALQPQLFARWTYLASAFALLVITIVTLAVPWSRLPSWAPLAVIFADTLAIGVMATNTEARFSFFWVFPVMWVGMHFSPRALAAVLATVGAVLLVDASLVPGNASVLRVFMILLSLTFIGITAHIALRRTRALRRLLRRQANRLTATLARRSDQERRTNEILNGVDTGIARLSHDGRILTVNDAYSRLYGLDPLDPLVPPRSVEYTAMRGMPVPASERPLARAARGETFTDARVWLFTAEGEWRALSVTAKRLRAYRDEEPSTLLLVHDVTAITHAQRERERLTAMASHELKHPLTVMIGNAELALELDDPAPRTRQRLEAILRASERMLEMTESMLVGSRNGFDRRDDFADVDLRQLVLESVASFRPTATTHDVRIDLELDEPLPVIADGFRLRQVVDNLVSNAIKYTPRDGEVRIVGCRTEAGVSLSVADTGIGISPDDLPRIMTPYFRTAEAKEKAGGTGLGLGITHQIVQAHGGTLSIDSRPGVGTTVSVHLPCEPSDTIRTTVQEPA